MPWQKFSFKIEKQYRLKNWDYSNNGYYFITICTKDRENYLGDIQNGKMKLSQVGMVTKKYLLQIPMHYKNILIDEFSIMPNHIHILLNNGLISSRNLPWPSSPNLTVGSRRNLPWPSSPNLTVGSRRNMPWPPSPNLTVGSRRNMPWPSSPQPYNNSRRNMPWPPSPNLTVGSRRNMPWHVPTNNPIQINNFSQPVKNSISMVINHYKSAVTRETNKLDLKFSWQTRFHDEIILNEKHYWAVKQYIKNNILNWNKDKDNIFSL